MTEKPNNLLNGFNGFLKTNSLKIFVALIAGIVWYNDQRYESKSSAEEKSVEIQKEKLGFLLHEQANKLKFQELEKDHKIVDERLKKKIKVLNELDGKINELENKIIKLETILNK